MKRRWLSWAVAGIFMGLGAACSYDSAGVDPQDGTDDVVGDDAVGEIDAGGLPEPDPVDAGTSNGGDGGGRPGPGGVGPKGFFEPCTLPAECGPGALCYDFGGKTGKRCTVACEDDSSGPGSGGSECPDDAECDGNRLVCRPKK